MLLKMLGAGFRLGTPAAKVPLSCSARPCDSRNCGWRDPTYSVRCHDPAFSPAQRRRGARLCSLRNSAYRMFTPLFLHSAASPERCRRGRRVLLCKAALEFEVTPTVLVLSSVLSIVALRVYIYFRMEYIIAAMLGRHVPRGGAKVVDLNTRGGRDLYYYPADIIQVVAVSSKSDVQLLENQAVRAGVPIQIKSDGPTALGVPSGSMDAVVSVLGLRGISEIEVTSVLREAVRVLKPGKPFVFVEKVEANSGFVQVAQRVVGGLSKRPLVRNLLPSIQEVQDLEDVDYEEVFGWIDPHVAGIAKKKVSVTSEPGKETKRGFKK